MYLKARYNAANGRLDVTLETEVQERRTRTKCGSVESINAANEQLTVIGIRTSLHTRMANTVTYP